MTKMPLAKRNDTIPPDRTDEPLGKVSKIEGFPIHQGGTLSKPAPSWTPDRSWPPKFPVGKCTKECFGCGNVTAHQHLHDCADGIAETHMVGSERFVCELCGHVTWAGSDGAERFPFAFDKVSQ